MKEKESKERLDPVSFRMTAADLERLDKIAEYCGLSRSQLIFKMIQNGMDEYDFFRKIGVIKAFMDVRDRFEVVKNEVAKVVTKNSALQP